MAKVKIAPVALFGASLTVDDDFPVHYVHFFSEVEETLPQLSP